MGRLSVRSETPQETSTTYQAPHKTAVQSDAFAPKNTFYPQQSTKNQFEPK